MAGLRETLNGLSTRTKVAAGVVLLGAAVAAAGSTSLLGQAQAPSRFGTVADAVAAGVLDAAVVDALREQGSVTALVEVESEDILRGVPAGPAQARAAAVVQHVTPRFAERKNGV